MLLVLAFDARFAVGYQNVRYTPEKWAIDRLRAAEDLRITLFHGSWCPGTRDSVPVLNQILVTLPRSVELRFVPMSREYGDPDGLALRYGVSANPTVILERGGEELGRLVETPMRGLSWEASMARLLE